MTDGSGVDLLDQLQARVGIVCLAGAGGKKTTMVRLAERHPGHVGLTATIKVPFRLKRESDDLISLPDEVDAQDAIARLQGLRLAGYAGARTRNYRLAGVKPQTIAAIHKLGGFDVTYVKVDGARMRLAKAHKPGEPILVPGAATVLLLASVHAIGCLVDEESVHHPDLFATVADLGLGQTITPHHLAKVVVHQTRMLHDAGERCVIPIINMADDAALLNLARETGDMVWQSLPGLERLAITSMIQSEPLKELLVR